MEIVIEKSLRSFFLTALLLFLIITITGCITDLDPRMFHSSYQYEISIRSDSPLSNVTFILPLPVKNNTPMVGSKILTVDDFKKENTSIEFTRAPYGLNTSGSTFHEGYDPWFVIIRSNEMLPEEPGNYVYHIEKEERLIPDVPTYSVNTLYPLGNESVFSPKQDFSWHEPGVADVQSDTIRYQQNRQSQKTIIFTNYSAKPETKVEIWINIQGYNSWKQGYDASIGNTYHDNFWKILTGPQPGWTTISGEFESGSGPYPNFNHPDWQKALNRTVNT